MFIEIMFRSSGAGGLVISQSINVLLLRSFLGGAMAASNDPKTLRSSSFFLLFRFAARWIRSRLFKVFAAQVQKLLMNW